MTDVEVQKLHPAGRIPETSEVHGLYSSLGWTEFMREVSGLYPRRKRIRNRILMLKGIRIRLTGIPRPHRYTASSLGWTEFIREVSVLYPGR